MITKLQSALRLTCMIFTIVTLFIVLNQTNINRELIIQILVMSLCFSGIRFIFFDDDTFTASPWRQLFFAMTVVVMIVAFNFIFGWKLSPLDMLLNSSLVIPTYIIIRLMNYRRVVKEVDAFNKKLQHLHTHK